MSLSVAEAISHAACSTALVAGLARQIVAEMLAMEPGCLVPVTHPRIHADPHVHLLLQPGPAAALPRVLAERPSVTLMVNSCFRVLPEQFMLWRQYEEGRCGIKLAAKPADSPHELGAALDVQAPHDWGTAFERHGFAYLGSKDPPHFQHMGNIRRDLGTLGIRAFQSLAALHGIGLQVDGVLGVETRAALLSAPAEGWK